MKLHFEFREFDRSVIVRNKNEEILGFLRYYRSWKCWVWEQGDYIIMSSDCLRQVVDKLKDLDKKKVK
jgi:hypothetical protein